MKILSSISQYLIIGSIFINCLLLYEVYKLPVEIQKALDPDRSYKKDTVVKIIPAQLTTRSEFIFFDGVIVEESIPCSTYTFCAKYPDELYKGYMYATRSANGANYYIWSVNPSHPVNKHIKGWFFGDPVGDWQYKYGKEKIYIPMLFPLMQKL